VNVMTVAIIPARGGSKRLLRKNILPILGKPLIEFPISAAIKCGLFTSVIVSTEDDEIAQIARSAGSQVIMRPPELCDDRSTVVQVCSHVLNSLATIDQIPEYFCCIYATAIFLTADDLRESFDLLNQKPEADFVMGVSEFNFQPVQALEQEKGYLALKWAEYKGVQSQFQPKLVASNGTLYWARSSFFFDIKSFYGKRLKGYNIPQFRAVDIDTEQDFKMAEILARHLLI